MDRNSLIVIVILFSITQGTTLLNRWVDRQSSSQVQTVIEKMQELRSQYAPIQLDNNCSYDATVLNRMFK